MHGDTGDFDTVLDLCRNDHRRIALAVLATEGRAVTGDDLTTAILEYNHQTPASEVGEDVLTRVTNSLYHEHIPRLESAGVVDHDRERDRVEPTDRLEELRPSLDTIVELDPGLEPPIEL
ncbi:DUF7344 domain-containing protein [Halovivax cerinus]|uniref:DUF7344 domain-containing protein n=1 Tax=Halovivax cerinus TaxID=1487865 RepID=A0ABD5NSK5_9EURY|nr:hypothetical protein [Halovivax cerinus]